MEKFVRKQLAIVSCIYIGQMLVGFGMGWTAPVVEKLTHSEQTTLPEPMTTAQFGWTGSLLYIGSIIGPHVSGYLSNVVGRKPCLMLGGFLTLVSFIMVVFTANIATIYALRIVKGFGTGIIAVCNVVYIGEIASTEIRGILLTITGIFSTLGTLVIYSVGPYVSYAATGYLGIAITVVYLVGLFFVPETPVYQILKGNEKEAQNILEYLGREHEKDLVIATKEKLEETNKSKVEWTEMFTVKSNRKALFTLITLGSLQQLSGVVAVIFYATTIFELAGSSIRSDIATIIIGVTQLTSSCITPFFVERSGRRSLLLFSTAACTVSLALLGIYFYLDHLGLPWVEKIAWIPLATLIAFFMSYDLGFGIIPLTLTGEMFRMNVRSTGSAVTITIAWLVGFFVSTAFGYVIPVLGGHFVFGFFSAACAVAFVFSAIFVPETKGKSLVEIEEMLNR